MEGSVAAGEALQAQCEERGGEREEARAEDAEVADGRRRRVLLLGEHRVGVLEPAEVRDRGAQDEPEDRAREDEGEEVK